MCFLCEKGRGKKRKTDRISRKERMGVRESKESEKQIGYGNE